MIFCFRDDKICRLEVVVVGKLLVDYYFFEDNKWFVEEFEFVKV